MSTVSLGPNQTTTGLVFDLNAQVSSGFVKKPKQAVSGALAWFDASTSENFAITSSNRVSLWGDKSGNNYFFTSSQLSALTANNFSPLYTANAVNGLGSLYFDGVNDYMFVSSSLGLASATDYTSIVVLSPRYFNAQQTAIGLQGTPPTGTHEFLALWNTLDTFRASFDGASSVNTDITSRNDNNPILYTVIRSGTSVNCYLNGKQFVTNGTVSSTVNSGVTRLGIGANTFNNGTIPYKGYICEIVLYNRSLSVSEVNQVEKYLSNKWRIPLLQKTLTNRDLINNKLATCQNNNIPITNNVYRLNPANATGTPLQSNFYFADSVSWLSPNMSRTITLEAWVKPNSFTFFGNNTDLGTIMIANSSFYLSLDGNGKFNAYLVGSAASTPSHLPSTTSVTRHAWNHVVWTYDGAYFRWYLNGVLDKTSSTTYTLGTFSFGGYLGIGSEGASTFGRFLDGYVSDCKIYNRSLTDTEILKNYQENITFYENTSNIVTSSLQAYLDADIHSSYTGSGNRFNDLTGNNNFFQLTNSPTFVSSEPKNFSLASVSSQYFVYSASISNPTGGTGISLPSANSWTCAFWFRTSTSDSAQRPLLSHLGSGPVYCLMGVSNGVLIYYHYNNAWLSEVGVTNVADNDWYHATFVNTNNTMIIYLNGAVEKPSFDSTINNASNLVNSVGGSWNYNFNGNIANFMYYNTNLSADQVLQNYNAQKFRFGR